MGNWCSKAQKKKSTAEITPSELLVKKPSSIVKLYGAPNDITTAYLRYALHYKPVKTLVYDEDVSPPVLMFGEDKLSGSVESVLRYLDVKYPHPQLSRGLNGWFDKTTPLVVWMTTLQHRSMLWHLERMVKWANDMVTRGGKMKGDPSMGSPRMEIRKFGESYSKVFDIMLEHAQMEEKLIFPILEMADPGMCKSANVDHGKQLPLMNGIKEDIKSIGVLECGSANYQEALSSLSWRLKRLQGDCKQHFEEEEKEILPLMEATDMQKERVLEECLDVMEETHLRLFPFFIQGLIPRDAMHYLDIITTSTHKLRVSQMLHAILQ